MVARITVSLIGVEASQTTLKWCLETLWPTDSSFDLDSLLSKSCVECGETLSSTVEKTVIPQENDLTYHSICNQIAQRGGTLHLPVLATVTVSFMRVEVLQQMPK